MKETEINKTSPRLSKMVLAVLVKVTLEMAFWGGRKVFISRETSVLEDGATLPCWSANPGMYQGHNNVSD